jgi:GntR family transcriptional regulator, rspAB operon transcriptional repressor
MLKSNSIPQKVQLGHQVYQILWDKIYRTEIEPGAYLGVGEIAEQLGVSRSPVRDALLMLVTDGVVEVLPTGGYRVIELSRKYIDDVFILRRTLELLAVKLSVQQLDREQVQQLHDTWAKLLEVDVSDSHFLDHYLDADHDLHQHIAAMSQNLLLQGALNKIISISAMIRRWYFVGNIPYDQIVLTAQEHLKVLEAMLAGDSEAAMAAQDEHLTRAHLRTLERLDST